MINKELRKGGVYAIVCSGNWRSYVGSTCNFKRRKDQHFTALRNNKHKNKELQYDFNTYGENNFYWEILEDTSVNKLLEREEYYLNNGCNLYNSCKSYKIAPELSQKDLDKFWSLVIKGELEHDCWRWKNKIDSDGYSRLYLKRKSFIASRISYKIH